MNDYFYSIVFSVSQRNLPWGSWETWNRTIENLSDEENQ